MPFSFLGPDELEIGTIIVGIVITAGLWIFGHWLHIKFKQGHQVCWAVTVTILLFTLILLQDWTALEIAGGFISTSAFAVYSTIEHRKNIKMPKPAINTASPANPVHPVHMTPGHTGVNRPLVNHQYINRLSYLYSVTRDQDTKAQIEYLYNVTKQIYDYIYANPGDLHKITFFMDYQLPKTIQLLDKYTAFTQKEVKSRNIQDALDKIAASIGQMKKIFENCLDSLYNDVVHEINVEIEVMEQLLKMEGLDANE